VALKNASNAFTNSNSFSSTVDVSGSLATKLGTSISTIGTLNDLNFGTSSLIRLTGASTQTITGLANNGSSANNRDGEILTIINAAAQNAQINDNNNGGTSSAGNLIRTGTGANVALAPGASITLIYDSTSTIWRVIGDVAGGVGAGVTTVGAIDTQTASANGAVISGNSIYLQSASNTAVGLVNISAQTFKGAKTFTDLITGNAGLSVSGAVVSLNSSSNFDTNINTGTSTGAINLGNSAAGAIAIQSGTSVGIIGVTNINVSANNNVNIATGTSTGLVSIGGGSGTFALNTTNIDISNTGAITGATGITLASGNFDQSASAAGTFKTGGGAVSLNGDTTLAANKSLTFTAGSGAFDAHNATGTFQTSTGANTLNGNTTISGANTFTSGTGTITLQGAVDVAASVSLATKAGTTFTTAGISNNAALNVASLYLMDTSGAAQVINGITAGRDGQHLTLVNVDASAAVTLSNNSGSATGAKIITGTGGDITLPVGASIDLI
jgi:hypothetical protein